MISEKIEKMIELSNIKKDYLGRVLELTKDQRNFIQNEDMDKLNKVMEEKEILMNKVDLLDIEFLSTYNQIKEIENIDSLEKINPVKYKNLGNLQEVIKDINNILEDISLIDKENTRIMKENLEEIKSGLKQVKEVKKAYKGYNYEPTGSILLDEKK